MVNRKGAELSLNFIIIAAIVLVVLIVAILFFTGGASKLVGEQKQVQQMSEQERGLALATCQFACTMKDKNKFENPGFSETVVKAGFTRCMDFQEMKNIGSNFEEVCTMECLQKAGATVPANSPACSTFKTKSACPSEYCNWAKE